jgi:hypothetical protein
MIDPNLFWCPKCRYYGEYVAKETVHAGSQGTTVTRTKLYCRVCDHVGNIPNDVKEDMVSGAKWVAGFSFFCILAFSLSGSRAYLDILYFSALVILTALSMWLILSGREIPFLFKWRRWVKKNPKLLN